MVATTSGADVGHHHAWPCCPEQWDELLHCRTCGLLLLQFRAPLDKALGPPGRLELVRVARDGRATR